MPSFSALTTTSDQTRYETSETGVHASPYSYLVSSTTQRHACRPGNESNPRKPHLGGVSAPPCGGGALCSALILWHLHVAFRRVITAT